MKTKLVLTWLVSAVAAAAVAFAAWQVRDARVAADELSAAQAKRDALTAQIADVENQIKAAEQRAREAERDSGELLKAVAAVRAQQQQTLASRGGVVGSVASVTAASRAALDGGGVTNAANGPSYRTATVDGRTVVTAVAAGAGSLVDEAEQERLARERGYQQELAKRRAREAKERAAFDEQIRNLSAEEKYQRLIERVAQLLASADFQWGIRAYNQAMTTKPAGLAVTEEMRALQAALQVQNHPVEVTLVSDGETWVSIRSARAPAKLQTATAKIFPGNYEVIGQRKGYQDVVLPLQVRADAPLPPVNITCTQPTPSQ